MSLDESACVYAALILADDGVSITSEKLATILKAAGVTDVEPFWPVLFAKALGQVSVKDIISGVSNVSVAAAPAGAAAAAPAGGAPAAKEEKKKEPEPESEDEDMSLSLFD